MLTICENDKTKVKELIKSRQLSSIVASNSDFIDDIILAMSHEGIIDCLDEGFTDKRRHNSFIPFKLIMALAVAAKMKIRTSLTDIPYAIQDYRTLAELGFNIAIENKDELFTEGTIRYLLNKYNADDLVGYYNEVIQNRIYKKKDIETNIHILDCTKIAVNFDNENYENSSIALDRKGKKMRGYKLASLRGIYNDTGIIEEIRFGTAAMHDLHLSEEILKTSPCLKSGDILIYDRGFISRDLINYLKLYRNVNTYIPLRYGMVAYNQAIVGAKEDNKWEPHPTRRNSVIAPVDGMGIYWESENPNEDVPINSCVVWDKVEDLYHVFITTDMNARAVDIIKTYEMRVEIEEDFRQLKDFWKLEDFKSTKYHMVVFHIICVLLGYLFYQLYINSELGRKYLGKSLPVILKNYKTKFLNHLVLYSGNYFCCMSIKEFFEFRDSCDEEVQRFLLRFFD